MESENTQVNKAVCVHLAPLHYNLPNLRVFQLLLLTDHTYSPEHMQPSVGSVPAEDTAAGRLPPIPEEPGASSLDDDVVS